MTVKGEDVVIFIYNGGVWTPYACARSCSLNVVTDTIETSVSGSGSFATFEATKDSYSGNIDGVVSLQEIGHLSLPDLRALQLAHIKILMRFQRTDLAGNVYTDEGMFLITGSQDTSSFDNINSFTINLQGTGALTQIFTPVTVINPGKVKRYPAVGSTSPAAGGETSFTIPSLINKDILSVTKDGVGNNDIILSGTPVNKEVKYTSGTGTFTWAIPFEAGENYYILYQDL